MISCIRIGFELSVVGLPPDAEGLTDFQFDALVLDVCGLSEEEVVVEG